MRDLVLARATPAPAAAAPAATARFALFSLALRFRGLLLRRLGFALRFGLAGFVFDEVLFLLGGRRCRRHRLRDDRLRGLD